MGQTLIVDWVEDEIGRMEKRRRERVKRERIGENMGNWNYKFLEFR